ncbi:hypothetical protein DXT99_17495 [Pontibacter diazotrophicus]|uniref:Prolyl-tRNA synthetase n=1 Tax=Pontibacter diazotrophicus TaxID=1400979 RepID=A0A3D8L8U5_9BACT|nr:hypothetical protein [Pontibacter diazotrophicus]RDV13825.1 hypothetical protein DXT99_17495 [Pontibacter diazotrophicus]
MKKYKLLTIAPMLTLLAAGCSTPIAMQSTEYDDMYYSSSDKTQYVEPEATTSQRYDELTVDEAFAEGEVLNPEYSGSTARTDDYAGDEYYDGREYDARNNWYQPSYSFVDPYWGAAYAPRMSSIAFYDPFYDPFFGDPFYYNSFRRSPYWGGGFNRGLNVSIGYGMGMGMPMAWGGGFYNQPMMGMGMGMGGWWPNSYGYGHYNGFRNGFNNGFYGGHPYGGVFYDRPVVIGNPVRMQNSPRNSRSAVVTDNPALRRPARGGVNQGESVGRQTVGSESVGRPARRGETVTSPTRTEGNVRSAEGEKRALPNRPSRTRRTPAINNQQEQRRATPTRTRTQESRPQQRQQQRVRPTESRPTRTYESRPTRTYESPVRSSPTPRSSGSSGSSGGGGRPPRGGN